MSETGEKRALEEDNTTPSLNKSKKKKKGSSGPPQPKNAMVILHEYQTDIQYEEETIGSVSDRKYKMSVVVDGVTYSGEAPTKKKAKLLCAESAVAALGDQIEKQQAEMKAKREGTQKAFIEKKKADRQAAQEARGSEPDPDIKVEKKAGKTPKERKPLNLEGKNAMMVIHELYTDVVFEEIPNDSPPHERTFKMKLCINDNTFMGEGRNKKAAKSEAAQLALARLNDIHFANDTGMAVDTSEKPDDSVQVPTATIKKETPPKVKMEPPVPLAPEVCLWEKVKGIVLETGQEDKGAPSLLNEYFPGVVYLVDKSTGENSHEYEAQVTVNECLFTGYGRTKKMAKANCAAESLKVLAESGSLMTIKAALQQKKLERKQRQRAQHTARASRGRGLGYRSKEESMYPIGNIMSSFVPSTENANLTTGFAQRGRSDHNKGGRGGGGSRGSRGGRGRGRDGRGGGGQNAAQGQHEDGSITFNNQFFSYKDGKFERQLGAGKKNTLGANSNYQQSYCSNDYHNSGGASFNNGDGYSNNTMDYDNHTTQGGGQGQVYGEINHDQHQATASQGAYMNSQPQNNDYNNPNPGGNNTYFNSNTTMADQQPTNYQTDNYNNMGQYGSSPANNYGGNFGGKPGGNNQTSWSSGAVDNFQQPQANSYGPPNSSMYAAPSTYGSTQQQYGAYGAGGVEQNKGGNTYFN